MGGVPKTFFAPANIRKIPAKQSPRHTAKAHLTKKHSLYLLESIEEIDQLLKHGLDNAAIIKARSTLVGYEEMKSWFSELTNRSIQAKPLLFKGSQQPQILLSNRVIDFGLTKLKECLASLEGVLSSFNTKKAFILLNIFNAEELKDPNKSKDIASVLELLFINENERENFIQTAIEFDKKSKDKANTKPFSFMTDDYKWYLTRIGFNNEQIEIESEKLNGKSFNQCAEEIRKTLISRQQAESARIFKAKQIAEADKSSNNEPQQASVVINGSATHENHKIHKEPKHLTDIEMNELVIKTYKSVIHYPFHNYQGFLKQLLTELNKHQAFKKSDFNEDKLETLLKKNFELKKEHFDVIAAYKELRKIKGDITQQKLANKTGIELSILNNILEAINDSEIYNIDIDFCLPSDYSELDSPESNGKSLTIVKINVPLFDIIEIDDYDKKPPSSRFVSIRYTNIRGNPKEGDAWHDTYNMFRKNNIIDVVLRTDKGEEISRRITSAQCRGLLKKLITDGKTTIVLTKE